MIITGSSKGIGRHMVDHYLNKGYMVVGCSRSDSGMDIPFYKHLKVDVTDQNEINSLFKYVKTHYNRLDVLINNAGIASMNHALLTPLSTVKKIFEINVFGSFVFTQEAAKIMMKRKYGRIINLSTIAVPFKLEGEAAYAASKAALNTFTEVLAREFAPYGITVNAVGPTPVKTDLTKNVPGPKMKKLLNRQVVKRYSTYEEVVHVIDMFVNKNSDMVTGQIVYLGGA